jgi:hypothetical protein
MGHPLKLQSPTKLARLGHFPPASHAGRLAGSVFYTIYFFWICLLALCHRWKRCDAVLSRPLSGSGPQNWRYTSGAAAVHQLIAIVDQKEFAIFVRLKKNLVQVITLPYAPYIDFFSGEIYVQKSTKTVIEKIRNFNILCILSILFWPHKVILLAKRHSRSQ